MSSQQTVLKRRSNGGRSKKSMQGNRQHVEKYAGDAYDLALRTADGLNYIRKLINVEEKYFDVTGASTAADSNGTVVNAFPVAQGVTGTDRVGDSVKLQGIRAVFWLRMSTGATRTACRCLLVRDLENAGAAPNVSDILKSTSSSQSPVCPYNFINTRTRFKILFDEIVALSINGEETAVISTDFKHEGHVRFRGATGSNSSMAQGSLWLLFISNETSLNLPDITYFIRTTYTDD